MKWSFFILAGLVLGAVILSAGCTQPDNSIATQSVRATAVQSSPLAGYALTAADVPAGYTLVTTRAKTSDEVGKIAKDLGWERGYIVEYVGYPEDPKGTTTITQTITTYPAANMPKIAELIETIDKTDPELVITVLPSPGLGENSRAFSANGGAQIVMASDANNPMRSMVQTNSVKQDTAEIIFTKGSTLEVLKMSGPRTDYQTLLDLSKKAYAMLP